jgi:hypothetical protein
MSTSTGAVAPHTIPGEIVTPDAVLDPKSVPAHNFFNVMRDLIGMTPYHTEGQKNKALDAVDAFENRFVPVQDRQHVLTETDPAGREDVSLRPVPANSGFPAPVAGPAIDYNRLAAAIVAMQQQAAAEAVNPPVPPASGGYDS